MARNIWDDKARYWVAASDAQAKKHPQRDAPIASSCDQRQYGLFYISVITDVS
jgi:hypothetical protein